MRAQVGKNRINLCCHYSSGRKHGSLFSPLAIKFWSSYSFLGNMIYFVSLELCRELILIVLQTEQSVEVYHDSTFENRRWQFPSHHFTVSVVWSPFLAKAMTFEDDNGVSSGMIQLLLDELDTVWTQQYHNFDYILIACNLLWEQNRSRLP